MSRTYTCKLFMHTNESTMRVYISDLDIVFNADDVITFLKTDLERSVKYLDDDELVLADVEVSNDEYGQHIAQVGCMNECGLFHICLNHMSPQVYTYEQNQRARELMHWITHTIIPYIENEVKE